MFNEIDASLRRLQLDYIDLYQLYGIDPLTPFEESLSALNDLVRSGKVRYIGLCNMAAWQIMKSLGVSEQKGFAKFVSVQAYYTIAGRDLERDIVPLLQDQRLGLMVAQRHVSVAQIALAWLLSKPFVSTVIIGAKSMDQLRDNIAAARIELTAEEIRMLDEVSQLPPEYPGWMRAFQGQARAKPPFNDGARPSNYPAHHRQDRLPIQ